MQINKYIKRNLCTFDSNRLYDIVFFSIELQTFINHNIIVIPDNFF
jgi:hypothetical protein